MRGMPFTAMLRWAQALACVTVLCSTSLFAQYGYFGQNKIQYRRSYAEFRHTIRHELVHVFQLSLAVQTFARYPRFRQAGIPLWWTEGLAEFFSAGEDSRDEMVLRDMTITGGLPTLPQLTYA